MVTRKVVLTKKGCVKHQMVGPPMDLLIRGRTDTLRNVAALNPSETKLECR